MSLYAVALRFLGISRLEHTFLFLCDDIKGILLNLGGVCYVIKVVSALLSVSCHLKKLSNKLTMP